MDRKDNLQLLGALLLEFLLIALFVYSCAKKNENDFRNSSKTKKEIKNKQ